MAHLANITPIPIETIGGMQAVAMWLGEVAEECGYHVENVSCPLQEWQQNPIAWAAAGEIWQAARVSWKIFKQRHKYTHFIVHAPLGIAPGPGLTLFHVNIPEYSRRSYSSLNPNYWKLRTINQGLDRLSASRGRTSIALSHSQACWLKQAGIPVDEVIYNPVDTKFFGPPNDRGTVRKEIGLPEHKYTALFVGRPDRAKNIDLVMRLAEAEPECLFILIGPAAHEIQKLQRNCRALGFQSQERVRDFCQASDILLLPSFAESFSIALAEAMSCGKAFIASKTGLAADLLSFDRLFREGVCSLSYENFYTAFRRLRESESLREELGAAGRSFAQTHFNEPLIRAKYINILTSLKGKIEA